MYIYCHVGCLCIWNDSRSLKIFVKFIFSILFVTFFQTFLYCHVRCLCTPDNSRSPKIFIKFFEIYFFLTFCQIFSKFFVNFLTSSCNVMQDVYALGIIYSAKIVQKFCQILSIYFFKTFLSNVFKKFLSFFSNFLYIVIQGVYELGMTPGVQKFLSNLFFQKFLSKFFF